jgi:hypothetical protein
MANKRLVSSQILDVELTNKFLLEDTALRINNSLESKVSLNLESASGLDSTPAATSSTTSTPPTPPTSPVSPTPSLKQKIFIPLDGTEIRKECTTKSEKLDRVRSLDGKTINGYHSYATVAVTENSHNIHILEIKPFSTKEEDFLSKNTIILDLIDSTLEGLQKLDQDKFLKVFLMDREFDSQQIIEYLCNHTQTPNFIIRAKHLNREFKEGKLNQINFSKPDIFKIQKLQIKNKKYENLTLKLSKKKLTLVNKYGEETKVTVVKSKLLDQDNKPIFKSSTTQTESELYLITNQEIKSKEQLYQCYLNYFIRWKIETVFKFLKEVLGLETFRVEDLQGIKNIISLTFLVGSYLNNLGEVNISQEFLIWLSKLGDGGGKVTKYYIQQGLEKIANYTQVNMFFKQENIPKSKQQELFKMVSWGDV